MIAKGLRIPDGVLAARNRGFLLIDLLLLPIVLVAAYSIRFEGLSWGPGQRAIMWRYLALALPFKIWVLWMSGLYRRLWRYASIADLERILGSGIVAAVGCVVLGIYALPALHITVQRVPLSVALMDGLLSMAAIALPRLLVRIALRRHRAQAFADGRRALIVGAGAAGGMIAKECLENPEIGIIPIGFLDDDATKHRHRIHNVPVLGSISALRSMIDRLGIDEVVIAMPTAPGRTVRSILQSAREASVVTRTVPGLFEILSGRKAVSALRQVQIEDLLRREPIKTDLEQVRSLAAGEVVLVTGAGGSIGTELCRQIAQLEPAMLIALGRGENSIFELVQELRTSFPRLAVRPVIADVRDRDRLARIMEDHHPYAVFHAAAHKHVPFMEENVAEAILNNVHGTRNVAELAAECGTKHMVLVSTDKAVRPTSIMGVTKRLAEWTVHQVAEHTGSRFVSVRFGNVLGSRGSVVPIFLRQIAAGGPVTITHPEMRRYFMTIPEAVQLVLQAGALAQGREVFVLDMGDPVRIADLATDLIRLSGLEVGVDIELRYTGVRPGEKLYEELFFNAECAAPTVHPKILRAQNKEFRASVRGVENLIRAARQNWPDHELRQLLSELVPDYVPAAMPGTKPKPTPEYSSVLSNRAAKV